MTLAIVLGSGGARGWCHIGVLRALAQIGVTPDVVAGCSMGALVGGAWAAGRLDALEDWARGLTRTGFLRHVDLDLSGGLVGGAAVAEILQDLGLPARFDALQRPFVAVATDLQEGREIWMQEGDLLSAIRGSISIPGAFAPQRHEGRWLVDGGVTNPVPVSAARALGATRFIAVNPNARCGAPIWPAGGADQSPWWGETVLADVMPAPLRAHLEEKRKEPVPRMMDVMNGSLSILTDYLRATRAAADPADVSIDADLQQMDVLELYRAAEAIDEGYAKTMAQAEAIRGLV